MHFQIALTSEHNGRSWLSSVQRTRRVADEKKKIGLDRRRISVKPTSADDGLPNHRSVWPWPQARSHKPMNINIHKSVAVGYFAVVDDIECVLRVLCNFPRRHHIIEAFH